MKEVGKTEEKNNKEKIEIPIETADCVIRHIDVFIKQTVEERKADFGEPCKDCKYAEKCGFDWHAKIQPLLNMSNEKIQLCYKMKK